MDHLSKDDVRRVESSDIQSPLLERKNKPHLTEHNLVGLYRSKNARASAAKQTLG